MTLGYSLESEGISLWILTHFLNSLIEYMYHLLTVQSEDGRHARGLRGHRLRTRAARGQPLVLLLYCLEDRLALLVTLSEAGREHVDFVGVFGYLLDS